jgi:hypothetical protein
MPVKRNNSSVTGFVADEQAAETILNGRSVDGQSADGRAVGGRAVGGRRAGVLFDWLMCFDVVAPRYELLRDPVARSRERAMAWE